MHNFHPRLIASLFINPLGNDRSRWVTLSTWLLKSSSNVSTIWRTPTEGTHIFAFCAHLERSIHISLSQTSLSPIFQTCSFQVPDHLAKPLARACELVWICTPGHCSFHTKLTTRCTAWSSSHWEGILFNALQVCSRVRIYVTAVHFQVMPACHAKSRNVYSKKRLTWCHKDGWVPSLWFLEKSFK